MSRNTILRAADQISLATWFGGSLMGAVALPSATGAAPDPLKAEGRGWSAWQPVQAAAIVTQLASGAGLTFVNKGRVAGQRGVAGTSLLRTALTGAALAATAVAAASGRRTAEAAPSDDAAATDAPDDGPASGSDAAPGPLAATRAAQWAVPVLTGSLLVLDAVMGEQQRPSQVASGVVRRLVPEALADHLAA